MIHSHNLEMKTYIIRFTSWTKWAIVKLSPGSLYLVTEDNWIIITKKIHFQSKSIQPNTKWLSSIWNFIRISHRKKTFAPWNKWNKIVSLQMLTIILLKNWSAIFSFIFVCVWFSSKYSERTVLVTLLIWHKWAERY